MEEITCKHSLIAYRKSQFRYLTKKLGGEITFQKDQANYIILNLECLSDSIQVNIDSYLFDKWLNPRMKQILFDKNNEICKKDSYPRYISNINSSQTGKGKIILVEDYFEIS